MQEPIGKKNISSIAYEGEESQNFKKSTEITTKELEDISKN